MPVDQKARVEEPHEPEEGPEAPVAGVLPIVNAFRRGVCQDDIDISTMEDTVPKQGGDEQEDMDSHLEIAELVGSAVVEPGPSQAQHQESALPYHPKTGVHGSVSARRILGRPGFRKRAFPSRGARPIFGKLRKVVIAEDEEQRNVEARNDEGQVFQGKITRGQDEIHPPKSIPHSRRIDYRIDLIRDAEYLHPGGPDGIEVFKRSS